MCAAVKLLVFLTLPPEEGATNFLEQHRCVQGALEALVRHRDVFAVLFSHMAGPLERYEDSTLRLRDDDGKTIQLFLTLIRNLLLGAEKGQKERSAENGSESQQLKENLLKIFFELRVTGMLVQMAKDARKKPFTEDSALLVEVFHLLFHTQSPSHLVELLERRQLNGEDDDDGGIGVGGGAWKEANDDGANKPAKKRTFVDMSRVKNVYTVRETRRQPRRHALLCSITR